VEFKSFSFSESKSETVLILSHKIRIFHALFFMDKLNKLLVQLFIDKISSLFVLSGFFVEILQMCVFVRLA